MIRVLCLLLALVPFSAQAATRCALIKNGQIKEYRWFAEIADPGEDGCPRDIPHKGVDWLPAPVAAPPAFDPAKQVLEGPVVVVTPEAVTEAYNVRAKTAQELDADKEEEIGTVAEFVLRRLCDHENRILVLEGKSAVTWEQCRKAIKDSLK